MAIFRRNKDVVSKKTLENYLDFGVKRSTSCGVFSKTDINHREFWV